MEITEQEYLELKKKISNLQETVNTLSTPKKITSLKPLLKEQIISGITTIQNDKPVFAYRCLNSDVWSTVLVTLAKTVHTQSPIFYMDYAQTGFYGVHKRQYIRRTDSKTVRKISELTQEQIDISVQMLNEIIPIYNRYFKQLHQTVSYDPTGKGDYETIHVTDCIAD